MPDIPGRLKPPRRSSAPSSPTVGEMYYDTGTNQLKWWNGTSWRVADSGSATVLQGVPYTFDIDEVSSAVAPASGGAHFNFTAARATQTLASGEDLVHCVATDGTALVALTNTSPGKLLRWADPTNLASYSSTTMPTDNNHNFPLYLVYDATTGYFYGAFMLGATNGLYIDKWDAATMTRSNFVNLTSGIPFGTQSSPIVTDGTYLYAVTQTNSLNDSKVYKYRLSDGVQMATLTLTNLRACHTLVISSGTLYMAGSSTSASSDTKWAASVPDTLASFSSRTIWSADSTRTVSDDSCIAEGYYWVAVEGSNGGSLIRMPLDLSSQTTVTTGSEGTSCYGVQYDGRYLWAVFNSTPGTIRIIDPRTSSVVETITLSSGENSANEWIRIGNLAYVTGYTSPSKVIRIPVEGYTTSFAFHYTGQDGLNVKNLIDTWGTGSGTVKGRLRLEVENSPTKWMEIDVTAVTDNTTYFTVTGTVIARSSPEPFADNDVFVASFIGYPGADIAGTIHAATGKTTPVDNDELALADSAASYVLKKLLWSNVKATLKTYFDTFYDWATVAHAATGKTTPVDADEVSIVDSAASNVIKKVTWANVKATLKTYTDTLYLGISATAAAATKLITARNIDGQAFDGTADITVIAPGTHAATSKATPVDADELPLVDSAASNVLKRLTWANLKATLKTYFAGSWDQEKRVSGSDATTSSATLVDITGLVSDTLAVSSVYEFEAVLDVGTSTGTNGTKYGVHCSVAPTRLQAIIDGFTTVASNVGVGVVSMVNADGIASIAMLTTASTTGVVTIKGILVTAGSGSPVLSVQHLKVTSGTSTVRIGSVLKLRKVG